jgi:hypothetical protein
MMRWTLRRRLELRSIDGRDWLAHHELTRGDANPADEG